MGNHLVPGHDPLQILMRIFFSWPFSQVGLKGMDSKAVNSGIAIPFAAPGTCLLGGSFLPGRNYWHMSSSWGSPFQGAVWLVLLSFTAGSPLISWRRSVQCWSRGGGYDSEDTWAFPDTFCLPFLVFFHGKRAFSFWFVDKEVSSWKVLCINDLCSRITYEKSLCAKAQSWKLYHPLNVSCQSMEKQGTSCLIFSILTALFTF